jgi:hypothetical protein
MKDRLILTLIILVSATIAFFLIAGMIWGIMLIIEGASVVREMGEILLVK